MAVFIDQVKVFLRAGGGGNGCVSVRREKFKPLAGPDGGNGGNGGSIILVSDAQVTTLLQYHRYPHQSSNNGTFGMGDNRHGAKGEDLILPVPVGTVVHDTNGNQLFDFTTVGMSFVAAAGGVGGLGNAALASPKRKAPGFALLGVPGEERDLTLELKTMADIALVGFPSAGKSSLISVISAAKPKIADYPFTTLTPNLGVVQAGESRFTVADVPGLIEGASEGKGLGHDFLRHVERCAALVHVLDCATLEPGRDPLSDLHIIRAELEAYAGDVNGKPLHERPQIVVLNKADVPEAKDLAEFVKPEIEALGYEVFIISATAHTGLEYLKYAMAKVVDEQRHNNALELAEQQETVVLRPKAIDERNVNNFKVVPSRNGAESYYRVIGDKVERWVAQTDFTNDEAVGFLADRLNKAGVEDALYKAGAIAGDTVVIGRGDGVVFDWEPTLSSAAELISSPRGSDERVNPNNRRTNQQRRAEYYELMHAKARARAELENERIAESDN